jgi:hypothetical protein
MRFGGPRIHVDEGHGGRGSGGGLHDASPHPPFPDDL